MISMYHANSNARYAPCFTIQISDVAVVFYANEVLADNQFPGQSKVKDA